jgi:hypothetical protein
MLDKLESTNDELGLEFFDANSHTNYKCMCMYIYTHMYTFTYTHAEHSIMHPSCALETQNVIQTFSAEDIILMILEQSPLMPTLDA